MRSRPQFTDLTYMGGTGPSVPMTIIFEVLLRVSIQAKFQIWCESDVPCTQDNSLPISLIWGVPEPAD